MSISLTLLKTLYFYDVPQLVLLENTTLGEKYLCLLYDDEAMSYVSIRISESRVASLMQGHINLREAYIKPELNHYYTVTHNEEGGYLLDEQNTINLSEDLLPESGFYLPAPLDEIERSIQADLMEWKKPILKLGVCDVDNAHTISINKLSKLTFTFGRFTTHLINKLASKKEVLPQIIVYGTEAASFNLKMYVETGLTDLEFFGSSADRYLQEIGNLLSWKSEEEFRQTIKDLKGHPLKSFRNFIDFLVADNLSLKYQWVSNRDSQSVFLKANQANLKAIQSILQTREDLESVILEATGLITKASIEKGGEWTLRTEEGAISGKVEDTTILEGVIIDHRYQITYEDFIEIDMVSSKEHHKAILKKITPL